MKSSELYKAIRGSLTGRLGTYLVQFAMLSIYSRLFTPEQFGIIASIQVFVVFFQLLADVGIGPAIISQDKVTEQQRNGIFSVTLLIGLVLGVSFYFFSYILNDFYEGYDYQNIAIIVGFSIIFNALNIIPVTSLNKDAKFILIARNDILSELISFAFVYYLYLKGYEVLALATRPLIFSLCRLILMYISSQNTTLGQPRFGGEVFHIRKIAKFASYQFGFNFVNYFSRNLDTILIGKYMGINALGIYDKSYQLMRYPLMLTSYAMNPAIQPILTSYRSDVTRVVTEHNKLTAKILFIALLISGFLNINSENIVLIIFGDQWLGVVPLIKILSFSIPIQAVLSTSGSFFQALNKPKLLFNCGVVSSIINVFFIMIGIYFGDIQSVAVCLTIGLVFSFLQCYFVLFKYCFSRSPIDFYINLIKSTLGASIPMLLYYILWLNINGYFANIYLEIFSSILIAILSLIFCYPILKRLVV